MAAAASRPTGPAATPASAPNLNWFLTNCSRPRSFCTIRIRSTAWPPICAPMLPPVMVRNAGADHVPSFLLRTLSTPWPRWPPTTNPPLSSEGNTAMPAAFSMMLCGTALSPAAMISWSTSTASLMRLVSSEDCAERVAIERATTTKAFLIRDLDSGAPVRVLDMQNGIPSLPPLRESRVDRSAACSTFRLLPFSTRTPGLETPRVAAGPGRACA